MSNATAYASHNKLSTADQTPEQRTKILMFFLLGLVENNAILGFQVKLLLKIDKKDTECFIFIRNCEKMFGFEILLREIEQTREVVQALQKNIPNLNIARAAIDLIPLETASLIIDGIIPLMDPTCNYVRTIIGDTRSVQEQKVENLLAVILGGTIQLDHAYEVKLSIRDAFVYDKIFQIIAPIFLDVTTRLGFKWN